MSTTTPITLTPEQVIAIVGHGATQEQLDGVRRELDQKIERLDSKVDRVHSDLDKKIDNVDQKIERKFNLVLGVLLANIAGLVAIAYWLGMKINGIG